MERSFDCKPFSFPWDHAAQEGSLSPSPPVLPESCQKWLLLSRSLYDLCVCYMYLVSNTWKPKSTLRSSIQVVLNAKRCNYYKALDIVTFIQQNKKQCHVICKIIPEELGNKDVTCSFALAASAFKRQQMPKFRLPMKLQHCPRCV